MEEKTGAAPAIRGVIASVAGLEEQLDRHVLNARVLVLGLAIQRLAEPEALVRADESILLVEKWMLG